ncbi:hypothetical protein KIPB_002234 [Kipferlia bialata]|uniref:Uncharacterized protein n=1 Tax=Kipferlia bialata TaxID=797122 RepID=A0A391NJZ3_9EUKA|nr:hypothetical protein KIPB_002234 [Kipferlia bialata]|eukprot:g2234.t1
MTPGDVSFTLHKQWLGKWPLSSAVRASEYFVRPDPPLNGKGRDKAVESFRFILACTIVYHHMHTDLWKVSWVTLSLTTMSH